MGTMFFKASRKKSRSYGEYRQIVKSGDTSFDILENSDDSIYISKGEVNIIIDCNKKTGVFSLKIN